MAIVDQEITISYGAVSIGGTTDRLIDSKVQKIRVRKSYEEWELEALFVTVGSVSDAAFAAEISALEIAFREPDNAITVTHNSETWYSFSPASNTGFNTRAEISKPGDDADTVRSRAYVVTLRAELPADKTGRGGRRDSEVLIDYENSQRRCVEISGTYTAIGGNSALDQYTASIDAYTGSVLSAVDAAATWELQTPHQVRHDDQNKVATFTKRYCEIIANQASGTLDDDDIVRSTMKISRKELGDGDSLANGTAPTRLTEMDATYETWINKENTTDLEAKWNGSIKDLILENIQTFSNAGFIAVTVLNPVFEPDENKITATVQVLAHGGNNILEYELRTRISSGTGAVIQKVHNGDPHAGYTWPGPGPKVLVSTHRGKVAGTLFEEDLEKDGIGAVFGGGGGVGPAAPGGPNRAGGAGNTGNDGYVLQNRTADVSRKQVGLSEGAFFVSEFEIIETSEFVKGFDVAPPVVFSPFRP